MRRAIGKPPFDEILDEMIKPIKTQIELREFFKARGEEALEAPATPQEQEAQIKLARLNGVRDQIIQDAALTLYPAIDTLMAKLPFCRMLDPTILQGHYFLIIKFEANADFFFEQDQMIVVYFDLSFKNQELGIHYSFLPYSEEEEVFLEIARNETQWGFHYHVDLESSLHIPNPHEAIPDITYTKAWDTEALANHFEDWVEFILRTHWEKYTKSFSKRESFT